MHKYQAGAGPGGGSAGRVWQAGQFIIVLNMLSKRMPNQRERRMTIRNSSRSSSIRRHKQGRLTDSALCSFSLHSTLLNCRAACCLSASFITTNETAKDHKDDAQMQDRKTVCVFLHPCICTSH